MRIRLTAFACFLAVSLHAQTVLVKPYVQPGPGSTLTGQDAKVLLWMTDQKPGEFAVEFGATKNFGQTAAPERTPLDLNTNQHYFRYTAALGNLPFDSEIFYRVKLGKKVVRESSFRTRATAEKPVRFIVVGDAGAGTKEQRKLAFEMAKTKPDSLFIVGDIVYTRGRVAEYMTNFWPAYDNTDKAAPTLGAPIMQSVTFHAVLGNHDVGATNLAKVPDGFAAFYFFTSPTNGPGIGPWAAPIAGEPAQVAAFHKAAGAAWPALGYYSFDNGPAHFVCLDANRAVAATNAVVRKWIEDDLRGTRQPWKFVLFHQPGFHSSWSHYSEQRMRLLSPLFEACGVDVVFAGHVHNYQRSKPLKFAPAEDKVGLRGRVDGTFTLDEKFDGKITTRPNGIIYVVSGGGGAKLYDPDYTNDPEAWKVNTPENWAPFTVKFIGDRHSFSLVELEKQKFTLRQIDDDGLEVDRIVITK